MIKYLFGIMLMACAPAAPAQFSDSITHFVRFDAAGNINRTNTGTAYLLNHAGRFSLKKKSKVLNAGANWVYGKQNGQQSNNDVTTTVDFNLYRDSSPLYYWGLTNYTSSFSLRIRNQLQTGLGLAYNIFNSPAFWLNISNGLLYETSSLRNAADGHEPYATFRNSFRLSYRLAFKNFIFNGTHFLQNSLRHRQDYIIRSSSGLEVKLNKWINLTSAVVYNQFRRTGTENLLFTYGLAAQRYF